MNKHTPGPWLCRKSYPNQTYWAVRPLDYPDGNESLATIQVRGFPFSGPDNNENGYNQAVAEAEANARLIAAAPELLEAIKAALDSFREKECSCDGEGVDGRTVGHGCFFHRIEDGLRAAIAKATGGDE